MTGVIEGDSKTLDYGSYYPPTPPHPSTIEKCLTGLTFVETQKGDVMLD